MKWGMKGYFKIDTYSGPLGYVFWCCGSRSQDFFLVLFRLALAILCIRMSTFKFQDQIIHILITNISLCLWKNSMIWVLVSYFWFVKMDFTSKFIFCQRKPRNILNTLFKRNVTFYHKVLLFCMKKQK